MGMEERTRHYLDRFDQIVRERMIGNTYQFALFDCETEESYEYGSFREPMPWASIYKLFVIGALLQMVDQGIVDIGEPVTLRPDLYTNGEGIVKHFKHLNRLSVIDCCKFVVSTSDNVCSDTLHELVGNNRIACLIADAGCENSCLTDNIDTLIGRQLSGGHRWDQVSYMYSGQMFDNYQATITETLPKNHTTATDCNRLWRYLLSSAFTTSTLRLFLEIVRTHNLQSRIGRYANYCNSPKLGGKTGSMCAGIVMNETNLLYEPVSGKPLGFFSFLSNHNRQTYFQSQDVLACCGLELVNIYDPRMMQPE